MRMEKGCKGNGVFRGRGEKILKEIFSLRPRKTHLHELGWLMPVKGAGWWRQICHRRAVFWKIWLPGDAAKIGNIVQIRWFSFVFQSAKQKRRENGNQALRGLKKTFLITCFFNSDSNIFEWSKKLNQMNRLFHFLAFLPAFVAGRRVRARWVLRPRGGSLLRMQRQGGPRLGTGEKVKIHAILTTNLWSELRKTIVMGKIKEIKW